MRSTRPVLLRAVEDGGADLGDWFCVTVVRPHADPLTDALPHPVTGAPDAAGDGWAARAWLVESVRRLGGDPGRLVEWDRTPAALEAPPDAPDVTGTVLASLVTPDGAPSARAVVLVEAGGCEGSRPQVLAALSAGAHVHSLFCGVHRDVFSYAADGRLLVSFDPAAPDRRGGEQPDALGAQLGPLAHAALLEDLAAVDDLVLALLTGRTGVPLDAAWWRGEHLLTGVVPVPDEAPAAPPGLPASVGALGGLAAADPAGPAADLLLATLQDAVRAALHLTALDDDEQVGSPLGQAVAEAGLLRRMALHRDPVLEEASLAAHGRISTAVAALWDAYRPSGAVGAPEGTGRPGAPRREDDPHWQRLQAAFAVTELLVWAVAPAGPHAERSVPDDVLLHVRFALGEQWPAFEAALVAHLAAQGGAADAGGAGPQRGVVPGQG